MRFEQFIKRTSGCASYLVGSEQAGVCAIVDPALDVAQYLRAAADLGLRITAIIETHAHADHISGARRLARSTGAPVCTHPAFGAQFPVQTLADGATIALGDVQITALHTPGHRPDSLTLAVSDRNRASTPWLLLTGDTLFVGDVGRPDLGQTPAEAAALLYESLFNRLLRYPDWTEVYPAHVAGSACGRAMNSKAGSTIGFERLFNPALQAPSKDTFVEAVVQGLPAQPPNFPVIVAKNQGALPVREAAPKAMTPEEIRARRDKGSLVLDVRSVAAFGEGHIEESVNAPLREGDFAANAAWAVHPEEPLVLVLPRDGDLDPAVTGLTSAGLDWIAGYLAGGIEAWRTAGLPLARLAQITVAGLRDRLGASQAPAVVDVRAEDEYAEGHIPGAVSVPLDKLEAWLATGGASAPMAFVCASGVKSAVAASKAGALGREALNIAGGMRAWSQAGFTLERQAPVRSESANPTA